MTIDLALIICLIILALMLVNGVISIMRELDNIAHLLAYIAKHMPKNIEEKEK